MIYREALLHRVGLDQSGLWFPSVKALGEKARVNPRQFRYWAMYIPCRRCAIVALRQVDVIIVPDYLVVESCDANLLPYP